ncbi:ThuA domain-containing protein [Haloactinomyces albus]|uniref:PKD repeat protein/type 1 glutamine amidotransferase n=1 Tax=Haloactinomyces albus TaxID=1352928 RepID=A0AAE4CN71_9ACTN|nr:ThuA domain-containing protein [Haloactinomyces albus]MDR7304180.1 PKD repeat protein/type 1 glutamine amidotransferase [Haloactinomyces albus]
MVLITSAALALGLSAIPTSAAPGNPGKPAQPGKPGSPGKPGNTGKPKNPGTPEKPGKPKTPVNVLVFHGPAAKQGDPVAQATTTIEELGEKNGFTVDASTDPGVFTTENLEQYRGVVFLSAKGVTLNADQEAAFRNYIQDGGGFLGVHDAARAEADSDWFTGLIGTRPGPSPTNVQKAVVSLVDRQHPANQGLPLTWTRSDQWLNWAPNPIGKVHTVAQVKEKEYDPGKGSNGPFHPISWCRDYDGGRSFYTGMGATEAGYTEGKFRSHLLGAIQWTTGMVRGDCQATIASNYEVERLTGENKPGQLDQHGEMHGMDIAPDGTVFYIGKAACPSGPVPDWDNPDVGLGCGTIHQWDPETKKVKLLTTLDVFGNRGSGGELVKSENGLVGITLDPDFADNGRIYIYWMPHDSIDRDKHIGKRTVSRLTYDFATNSIDKSSRVDILQWNAQIHSCCHVGGGMDFDDEGNLYIGSGDNNSSRGSSGYSGNNWTKAYKGLSFQDARRTAGNTNNLNGKILRINPLPIPDGEQPPLGIGSTYTIPEDNLFPPDEYSGDKTRPEIYVMGVRNISTLSIDAETGWLKAAWVGPDAFTPSPKLGPAKYETATIITSAGNQGWPYCMGNKQPYRNRSNTDAGILTNWYDCDNLKNTSPRNTGLVNIPDARDNMIWYSPGGGGPVFPDREGSDVPTYKQEDATYTQPYLKGGGQSIMSGPTYHRSQVNTDSGVAWPSYWEDKWFIGDQSNPNNRIAVTLGPDSVTEQDPPAFAESLRRIIPAGGGDDQLQNWMMDSKFGPDGALYMIDYGGGFFSLSDNQKLIRITYEGGPATPAPAASATPAAQNTPMKMAFTGEKSGGVSYTWDFGDGATSTKANPTHTYTSGGTYTATLTVTYSDGATATTKTEVNVECAAPDTRPTVRLRGTDTGVANHQLGGGCTINDLIDDESDWSDHGTFVRYVGKLADRLKTDGVISGRERGMLSRAAGRSDIGKKDNTGRAGTGPR